MFTCSKRYNDIPFAHRQHTHKGHCSLIHGHNWGFEFTFAAHKLDENHFVVDFGGLKLLKASLDEFDHALVMSEDDPAIEVAQSSGLARVVVVGSASAEGLAKLMHETADQIVRGLTADRARCVRCVVFEDSRNSATFEDWSQLQLSSAPSSV